MAHLVVRHDLPLAGVEDATLLLEAGDHALDRGSEILERDRVSAAPRCDQRGFVDEISEIGAGEPRRDRRDLL